MKVPVGVTFHPSWWHKNAGVCFDRSFFYDPEYRIKADIAMRKYLYYRFGDLGLGERDPRPRPLIGSDMIASGFLHSEIMGCEVRYLESNPPEVICGNISDGEGENLCAVNLDDSPVWHKIEEQIGYLRAKYGSAEPCINLMGVQNIALDLRGQQLFVDYYENPELARKILQACANISIEIGKRLTKLSKAVSAGVTAIVKKTAVHSYVTSNCSVEMVSLEIYNNFLLEYDNILSEHFTDFGIHHCGKSMEHVASGYAKVKNLKFAEVGAFSDIAAVRRFLPAVHLNARYSPVRLKDASSADLAKDIDDILSAGGPPELLSLSCVGIDADVPDDRIRELLMMGSL